MGGVVLNHLGWAALLGLRTGVFGKQADDENGRFLREAMERHGIEHRFVLDGSASAFADIYVDDAGGRAIYMAPGATAETTPEFVRRHHAEFIRSAARVTTEVSQLPLGGGARGGGASRARRGSPWSSISTCRPRRRCPGSATRPSCARCSRRRSS